VLSKRLTILGQEGPAEALGVTRPTIAGTSRIDGASAFTFANCDVFVINVVHVDGLGIIDNCRVTAGMLVDDCPQITLSRITVTEAAESTPALRVKNSGVTLVDSQLTGGPGYLLFFGTGGAGQAALDAENGSFVLIAGSSLVGGAAGIGGVKDGPAGHAIRCVETTVIIRGSSTDQLAGGYFLHFFGATPGLAISCYAASVLYSGVTLNAPTQAFAGGTIVEAPQPEPYVEITGSDAPGEQRSIDLYGPAGAHAFLVLSLRVGHVQLPKLELPVQPSLFDALVLDLMLLGPDTPQSLPVTVPAFPGLVGTVLHVQAISPAILSTLEPGKQLVTNPAALIVLP
jgi:hypothetical protein